jgi:hypothetical protein
MRNADTLPNQTGLRSATNHTSEDHYTAVKAWKPLPLSQDALIYRLLEEPKSSKESVQVTLPSCIRDVSGSNLGHETDCPIVFRALPQELQVNERTAAQIRPLVLWLRQWTFRFHKRMSFLPSWENISIPRTTLLHTVTTTVGNVNLHLIQTAIHVQSGPYNEKEFKRISDNTQQKSSHYNLLRNPTGIRRS